MQVFTTKVLTVIKMYAFHVNAFNACSNDNYNQLMQESEMGMPLKGEPRMPLTKNGSLEFFRK